MNFGFHIIEILLKSTKFENPIYKFATTGKLIDVRLILLYHVECVVLILMAEK